MDNSKHIPFVRFLFKHQKQMVLLLPILLFAPFLHARMIRGHGDEKVYVGQALEMLSKGNWFQQLQFGEVNYIKGPLQYVLSLAGLHAFGLSLWSVLWMNLALLALAAYALGSLFEKSRLGFFAPLAFCTSVGAVGFLFTAQMDSALMSLYAMALGTLFLKRNKVGFSDDIAFWLIAAAAGLLKSPLHAGLLGTGAILYWIHLGKLRARMRSPGSLAAWAMGVFVCTGGYAFGLVSDTEAFLQTYWLRETWNRHTFVDSYAAFVGTNLVSNLLPWSVVMLVLAPAFWKSPDARRALVRDARFQAALSLATPTFLFFSLLGHHAPWYGLPLCPLLIVMLACAIDALNKKSPSGPKSTQWGFAAVGGLFAAVPALLVLVLVWLGLPDWWPLWRALVCLGLMLVGGCFVLFSCRKPRTPWSSGFLHLGSGTVIFFVGALGVMAAAGERELDDLKSVIEVVNATHASGNGNNPAVDHVPLAYLNLKRNNYSEWGLVSVALGLPIEGIHAPTDIALLPQQALVLIPSGEDLDKFQHDYLKSHPAGSVRLYGWRRWVRNARGAKENLELGKCKSVSWPCFERTFWIASLEPRQSAFR